jgi:hypothetical protein
VRSDIDKYYDLLGVKPGVSVAELKAAHRDLAKVWHPDRFGHDERLQKKAQEKLKEINEAYEIVVSGKVPRPTPNASNTDYRSNSSTRRDDDRQTSSSYSSPAPERSKIPVSWIVVPLLVFGVVFFAASRYSTRQDVNAESTTPQVRQEKGATASTEPTPTDSNSKQKTHSEVAPRGEVTSQAPLAETSKTKLQPLHMTTVLIDPSTGLLAKADCPVKTRMTYSVGNEPHGYCNAPHGPKTAQGDNKDSAVKSLAKKVVSPKKWLGSGSKESEGERQ